MAGTAGRTDSRIVGTSPPPQLSPRALPCGRSRGPYCAPSVGRRLPFGCPLTTATGMGPIVCPIPVAVCPPTADHIRIHIYIKVGWVAYRTICCTGGHAVMPPGKAKDTPAGTHLHVFPPPWGESGPHASKIRCLRQRRGGAEAGSRGSADTMSAICETT